jgi:membrane-bound lytic murein transglycosylase D
MTGKEPISNVNPPGLRVTFEGASGRQKLEFQQRFVIGRTEECEVCIRNEYVSRTHAEVSFDGEKWWVRDLDSSNGIFVDGRRVNGAPIDGTVSLRLGVAGPIVSLEVEKRRGAEAGIGSETAVARYIDHYFGKSGSDKPPGEHTILVREAFQRVRKRQQSKYVTIIGALAVVALGVSSYAVYEHEQAARQRALAQDLFYNMKSLDVEIANVERLVLASHNVQALGDVASYRSRRDQMERSYDQFLASLHVYDPKMTSQHKLVLRVARIFGECELAMPADFVSEIDNYIKKWQSSDRLAKAIAIAHERGYTKKISEELLAQDLPPQFFYLALQESGFDPYSSGPMTRKGIAKGMWQFIPETAAKYSLKIGPLFDLRRPDPADERQQWQKETTAAARYLKDLYSTDAQASGLLVMACYNWGEDRVLPLVRSMPANPKERNFWRLLSSYRNKIPQETYDYVFYIASAAVIGENPRLFGFNFDDPLAGVENR